MSLGQYSLWSLLAITAAGAAGFILAEGESSRLAASHAFGPAPQVSETAATTYAAEVTDVTDGDTFSARVAVWPGIEVSTKVRLRGVDAPELRARCEREKGLAVAAREKLAAILAEGAVRLSAVAPDKYGGRVIASAATGLTPDVSRALLALGLARPYGGGRRTSWCDAI